MQFLRLRHQQPRLALAAQRARVSLLDLPAHLDQLAQLDEPVAKALEETLDGTEEMAAMELVVCLGTMVVMAATALEVLQVQLALRAHLATTATLDRLVHRVLRVIRVHQVHRMIPTRMLIHGREKIPLLACNGGGSPSSQKMWKLP